MLVVIEMLEFLEVELVEIESFQQVGYSLRLFHLNPIIIKANNITFSADAAGRPECPRWPAAELHYGPCGSS